MKKYIKRTIEEKILKISTQFPVIAITGPRQSGKSTMLKNLFPQYNYVSFDEVVTRNLAKKDPALFVGELKTPVIIDEIQYVPEILPYIKINVDNDRVNGRFILTGSQMFILMAGISESLAGRIALFELLPFSFEELGEQPHKPMNCYKQILKGFYPTPNTQETDIDAFYGGYLSTYIERDVRQIENLKDISAFQNFIQLLAGRTGGLLNVQNLARDCNISHATATNWLSILESSRIIYLLRPYFRNIAKRIIKSPKIYFTDTGLLAYLLKYRDVDTLFSGAMAGAIFENMIIIEALKREINYKKNNDMYFYRDSNGVEVDLVIDKGQEFLLFEIKSGKSLKIEMTKNLMSPKIEPSQKFILSFNESPLNLTKDVKAIPWWEMQENI